MRSLNARMMPTGTSQFEVCGATATTNLGTSGTSPSARQPVRPRSNAATPRRIGETMGVLKIVTGIRAEGGSLVATTII